MNNTQNQIDQLYALIDAYSNVSHLVDCGELVWKAHQAIDKLEESESAQRHSCLAWSKEDFNGDERLMNQFFTECNEMIIQNINEMKDTWMSQLDEQLHYVQTNYVGYATGAYQYVDELNELIGRKAFSCLTKKVEAYPYTDWIVFGDGITQDEIDRLNLSQDFIIN